jgi:hypothetical protein
MSPKLEKLLMGIGDLEVAKTCMLSLQYALHQSFDACVGPPWWVHLYICQWYNNAINYHNASIFFRWFVFWIMSLLLTRCIATFFIYHVIVNIIIKFNMKKKMSTSSYCWILIKFTTTHVEFCYLSHYLWLGFSESQNPRCVIGKRCQHRLPNIANFKINHSLHKPKPKQPFWRLLHPHGSHWPHLYILNEVLDLKMS